MADSKIHIDSSQIPIYERHAFQFFTKGFESSHSPEDKYETLSKKERNAIVKTQRISFVFAGLLGSLGVILLYAPILINENLFPVTKSTLFIFAEPVEIPIWFTLYGLVLAISEIYLLSLLNLHTVRRIAVICGFPNKGDQYYQDHLKSLYQVGLEKPNKRLLEYNLDPFYGMSKWQVFAYQTFNKMRATLSNMLVKVFLARVFGRFAIRTYVDLVGVPIFAFWNIYATNKVIKEAKIRIMAPGLIKKLTRVLAKDLKDDEDFKALLYKTLQFITMVKRDFHHNHYLLAHRLIRVFDIKIEQEKPYTATEILEMVKDTRPDIREALAKLLVFGMLIDGQLSGKEKKVLEKLYQDNLITFNFVRFKVWERSFISGKGLDDLFTTNVTQN